MTAATETTAPGLETAPEPVAITEPGVYSLPDDVYHGDPVPGGSLSASGALQLLPPSCPARFAHEREHGREPKQAWDIGHAAHRLVLGDGPELVKIDRERWDTNAVKAEVAAVRDRGAVPLKPGEWQMVHDMADRLREHPIASALFDPQRGGKPEQSLFWRDQPTGVMLRARLDWLPAWAGQRLLIPDYKTGRAADHDSIERAICDYGYHLKGAWYTAGAAALGLAPHGGAVFLLVMQEKTAPYLVTVAEVEAPALRVGQALSRRAVDVYAECVATGRWPGYADDVIMTGLPQWAQRRYEEELEIV